MPPRKTAIKQPLNQTNFRDSDPNDMFSAIREFPNQIRDGVRIAQEGPTITWNGGSDTDGSAERPPLRRVVILGMGGSAIGGDMLRSYVSSFRERNGVDVIVSRDYVPPAVDASTLLVVSSYSGNTEETLTAFRTARKDAGAILAVTTGGTLGKNAKAGELSTITLPTGLQPRAALGYSFFPLLYVLAVKSGIFGSKVKRETERGVKETIELLDRLSEEYGAGPKRNNPAFRLAERINGKVPVIYSATERLDTVNLRWRGQIQENAKYLAFGNLIPEMNHNEINGWGHPKDLVKSFTAIFLRDREDNKRNALRVEITRRIIGKSASAVHEIESQGSTLLARMFSLIHLGDWVSYYLAVLNGVDPSPVPVIEDLKKELAK